MIKRKATKRLRRAYRQIANWNIKFFGLPAPPLGFKYRHIMKGYAICLPIGWDTDECRRDLRAEQ